MRARVNGEIFELDGTEAWPEVEEGLEVVVDSDQDHPKERILLMES